MSVSTGCLHVKNRQIVELEEINQCVSLLQGAILAAVASRKFPGKMPLLTEPCFLSSSYDKLPKSVVPFFFNISVIFFLHLLVANGDVIGSQVLKFLLSPQYIVSVDCCDLCRKKEKRWQIPLISQHSIDLVVVTVVVQRSYLVQSYLRIHRINEVFISSHDQPLTFYRMMFLITKTMICLHQV